MNANRTYLLDTHVVYWHMTGSARLSSQAKKIILDAQAGNAVLVVHYVVLAELYYLLAKNRQTALYLPFLQDTENDVNCRIESIALDDIRRLADFAEITEMHDRLIAIAANRLGATVVTRDPIIQNSPQVDTVW